MLAVSSSFEHLRSKTLHHLQIKLMDEQINLTKNNTFLLENTQVN